MSKLILMRHGESLWNRLNLFTGGVDVPLSQKGIEEAIQAGKEIRSIPIDVIYVSSLVRSLLTALIAMAQHEDGKVPVVEHPDDAQHQEWGKIYNSSSEGNTLPVYRAWQLNERLYGELQGLNKAETAEKYGAEQVQVWRRSYDTPPPGGESLQMTAQRTLPYFEERIVAELEAGKNVLVSAHGNSLRSILMQLDGLNKEEVVQLEIPTGKPLLYDYSEGTFTKVS